MTIENLFKEFELLLSDIAFAGLHNTQPAALLKLDEFKAALQELQMPEGLHLIAQFTEGITAYQTGKNTIEKPVTDLCLLDFYVKTILGNVNQ